MQCKFLFTVILLFPSLNSRVIPHLLSSAQTKSSEPSVLSSFDHIKKSQNDFWELGRELNPSYDTNSLKNSNWYSEAMKRLVEKEYEINYDEQSKCYSSPNRKQNLRSFYSSGKFTLVPRNDSADKWKLTLKLNGVYVGKNKLYSPSANPVITKNENNIRFNNDGYFIAEYINNKEGIRQNFIIPQQPIGNPSKLSIQLEAGKEWFVNKIGDKEIHFAKAAKKGYDRKLTYNGLKAWDVNGKELVTSFSVNKSKISIEVITQNAVYPITIDPLSSSPNWTGEGNQAIAYYGRCVVSAGDVNGDGYCDVIVGADQYDNGQTDEGKAFVYYGSITGLPTSPNWTDESNQNGSHFGFSASSAGDVNGDGYSDIIIGAFNYDSGEAGEGKVFAYYGSAVGLSPTVSWTAEGDQIDAQMGRSVATAGDVNGDGYSDIIIGAYSFDNGQVNEGKAFVYNGSSSGLSATPSWSAEGNQTGASFGISVACAGDVNGDSYSDIIIGANAYDNGENDEGKVFVYYGSASGLALSENWTTESNQPGALMGVCVANAGDVNGDGYSDVIIGAIRFANGETDEGRAFVFYGSAGGLSLTANWTTESDLAGAQLGWCVSSAGDINGDGYADVIVGAPYFTNGGKVFVFYGSSIGLSLSANWTMQINIANSEFGTSVSTTDVNGDGFSDVLVGAQGYSNGEIGEGGAFVYYGSTNGVSINTQIQLENNQVAAQMGRSVATAGDVNGDGYSDVIIGAPTFDNGETDEGAAFVYLGSASGITNTVQAQLESNQAGALMGWSVACAGDVNGDGYSDVIVGAFAFDAGQSNEGAAFIYHGGATGINTTIQAQLEGNQNDGFMGWSVASAGDVNGDGYSDVIVGAVNGTLGIEAAFVFHGSSTGINTTIQAQLVCNQANAGMGNSVASAGDVNGDGYSDVIVGAYMYNNGLSNQGSAFVYLGSITGINPTIHVQLVYNQADAELGYSVSSAGDVNGDGYSDVIVGVAGYVIGPQIKGAAFIYYGSSTGVSNIIQTQLIGSQTGGSMGQSVASAGDVNGDGYSDVIVGAYTFANGQATEGAAFIFHGGVTGISTTVQTQLEGNLINAGLGFSVASAGDVNGDGYSDVIIGALYYTNGQADEGAAFVYLGNNGGGFRNNLRLYNTDLVTPIQRSNILVPNLFGAGLYAKSAFGRAKGKLVWEVKGQSVAFSGNPITNSTSYLSKQTSFTDLGIAGIELKSNVQKINFQNKIRVRVEYDKVTGITGQVYGPWRYPPGYTQGAHGMNSIPLPVTLISFNGRYINANDVQLNWITSNEINIKSFIIERSSNGTTFMAIGELPANGVGNSRTEYSWIDKNVKDDLLYYRLKLREKSGDISYTKTIILNRNSFIQGFISPNPILRGTDAILTLQSLSDNNRIEIRIFNAQGQLLIKNSEILHFGKNEAALSTKQFASGLYVVSVLRDDIIQNYKLVIQQ